LKRVKTCIRGNFRFLQYLPAAGEYEIRFRPRPTRKNAVVSIPVSVMDSQETNVDNFTVSGKEYVYKFRTHGPCLRVFDIAAGRHAVFVISPYTGQAFCANAPIHMFHGAGHEFSFLVPAGVEEVPVLLATNPGEPADFQLVASGKIMADEKNIDGGRAIRVKRPDPSAEEVREMILRHARMVIEEKGEYTGIREMRKHVAWYTAGMPHSANLRRHANTIISYRALESLLEILDKNNNL